MERSGSRYFNHMVAASLPFQSAASQKEPIGRGGIRLEITLVHGTWARGLAFLAWRRVDPRSPAKWCRPESTFCTALHSELDRLGYRHDVSTLEWTGANSLRARHDAAVNLAGKLTTRRRETDTDVRQVVIAHSHGGNIALQARHLMEQVGKLNTKLSIVTIATPFVRVTAQENLTKWQSVLVGMAAPYLIMAIILYIHFDEITAQGWNISLTVLQLMIGAGVFGFAWMTVYGMETWGSKVVKYGHYSELGDNVSLLVLRGTEDEATMVLTLGLIGVRIYDLVVLILGRSALVPMIMGALIWLLWPLGQLMLLAIGPSAFALIDQIGELLNQVMIIGGGVFMYVGGILFAGLALAALFRSVFGWEVMLGYAQVGVTAHSVPDVASRITVKTLSRGSQGDAPILHSLYDHPDCVRTIAAWLAASGLNS